MNFIKKGIQAKREWRAMQARAKALPTPYRIVYFEIQKYMLKMGMIAGIENEMIFEDIIQLFETSAKEGKYVLDVTGDGVALFCDELAGDMSIVNEAHEEAITNEVKKAIKKELGGDE